MVFNQLGEASIESVDFADSVVKGWLEELCGLSRFLEEQGSESWITLLPPLIKIKRILNRHSPVFC